MNPRNEQFVAVDVQLPAELFADLDAYAVAHGYRSVDQAVSDALDQHTEQR